MNSYYPVEVKPLGQYRRASLLRLLATRLARYLAANDYAKAAILILAFEDYGQFHRRQGDGPEIMARVDQCSRAWPNDLVDENEADRPRHLPTKRWNRTLGIGLVLLTLGGALIPGWLFRQTPILATLAQVEGKFPARYVAYPGDPALKRFNRRKAFRLAAKGLGQLLRLFFLEKRLFKKLKNFAETYTK